MDNTNNNPSPLAASEALTNILEMEDNHKLKSVAKLVEYIRAPLKVPTPKEKVKKRPDGFDYVESAWMDNSFKSFSPLYDIALQHISESLGWIDVIVSITDKITGNTELGAGSARIMVRRGVTAPQFGDVIDKGNNLTAALSKAIKNAQSRFGHAADVYHKLQELPTDDEKKRYDEMLIEVTSINSTRAYTFSEQWEQLGTGYSEYLDRWQVYVERNSSKGSNKTSII